MNRRWILFLPLGLIVVLAALFSYALLSGVDPSEMPSALEGEEMPGFRLSTVQDSLDMKTADDLVGEPFLLNIWATWCPSCKWEHPYLNSLSQEGVRIIGVNYKDERDLAQAWLRDYANPYEVDLYDPNGDLGFELGVTGAPETFFIDSQGVIQYRYQGPIDSALWQDELKAVYENLE